MKAWRVPDFFWGACFLVICIAGLTLYFAGDLGGEVMAFALATMILVLWLDDRRGR